jgi:hypothetical protein
MIHELLLSPTETDSGSHPCCVAFTAVTRVQIPSGTPNLFRSLRGTPTFGAGTKRHSSVANFWSGLPNRQYFRTSGAVLVGTKRHTQSASSGSRTRGCAKEANDLTLSSAFVNCDRLSVRIQCHSAGSLAKQFLQPLISALVAPSKVEYVCRNVCHPMCAIPIFTAAGRIKLLMRVCPQYGFSRA